MKEPSEQTDMVKKCKCILPGKGRQTDREYL